MEQDSITGARTARGPEPGVGVDDAFLIARLSTHGPGQTQDVAARLATVLTDGDLLVLTGDLGAGKTCFTQGLGRGLGIEDRMTSPTFTLANRYRGRLVLHHLDVYRLESLAETVDLGLAELLEDGVTVIEWGDRIDEVLPHDHLVVALRYPELEPGPDRDGADDDLYDRIIDIRLAGPGPSRWSERDIETLLSEWGVGS
ncbi:MAG: tRNA (adenosine(37)-N6)-threonylcarbamoyltransferase complex ATPase subunit type 1 TsaE [Acidimicrobiales bacterium]